MSGAELAWSILSCRNNAAFTNHVVTKPKEVKEPPGKGPVGADTPCPLVTADLECHEYTCSDFRLLDESDTYCDDHHMICQDMRPYENNECIIPSVCEEFKKCVRCCEPENFRGDDENVVINKKLKN
ncbi:hypothetical protein CWI36_0569p0020 [Hamiltosporidium magnivora]|uniref:Uncharacterized protein n=1 Tax=Hamiltosporidium magnivora TaxID=148818 RepID=A0A4Q9LE40_9MICR|nr:hypothetical protein CWI36_0569p0020 [Hamiltosporidium magnivora]